jgi:hypothetical protein
MARMVSEQTARLGVASHLGAIEAAVICQRIGPTMMDAEVVARHVARALAWNRAGVTGEPPCSICDGTGRFDPSARHHDVDFEHGLRPSDCPACRAALEASQPDDSEVLTYMAELRDTIEARSYRS